MVPVGVDEPDRVEDLQCAVRIEARDDLRDHTEVAVDELAEPPVVVDRTRSRTPADEELEAGDAERVLDVDGEEADPKRVVRSRPNALLLGPDPSVAGALLVRHAPDLSHLLRPVEVGHGELAHRTESSSALQVRRVPADGASGCRTSVTF